MSDPDAHGMMGEPFGIGDERERGLLFSSQFVACASARQGHAKAHTIAKEASFKAILSSLDA
jgi:hypothetical protein